MSFLLGKNKLLLNYDIMLLNNHIEMRTFVIVFNLKQLDYNLIHLKTQLIKECCPSGMWTGTLVNQLYSKDLEFLGDCTSMFHILINDTEKLIKVINLLDNINFYILYKKRFSNIINKTIFLNWYNQNNKLWFLHFSIFKLLFNIIIIILYFITILLKYINIK